MRENGVRHLPVVDDDAVVGTLSEREADLIAAIAERSADEMNVKRAMITNVLEASPGDPVAAVARRMAAAKCGSTIVADDAEVVGVITTVDALAALAQAVCNNEVSHGPV